MSAEDIYSAVEKDVLEETDNTTVYNILESARDLDDDRIYSAEETDIIPDKSWVDNITEEQYRATHQKGYKNQFG